MSRPCSWTPLWRGSSWRASWAAALTPSRRGAPPAELGCAGSSVAAKVAQYTAGAAQRRLEELGDAERRMLPLLIDAAREMDTIYWQQAYAAEDSLLATIKDSTPPPLRRDQRGPVGSARRGGGRSCPASARSPRAADFYPRDMTKAEFEAAAGRPTAARRRRCGASTPWCGATASGGLTADPLPPAYRRADAPRRGQAARGRRPGRRCRPAPLPRAPGHRARDRRLPAERHGLDGHEAQHARHGDRPDRDLRGRAVRLQGRRTNRTSWSRTRSGASGSRSTPRCCPALQRGLPVPAAVQARDGRAPTPTSTRTTSSTTPARPTPASKTIAINLPERRGSAAQEGHPPAPAQERDARQVRPDPRAHRATS